MAATSPSPNQSRRNSTSATPGRRIDAFGAATNPQETANTASSPRLRTHRAGTGTSRLNPHQAMATYTAISAKKYKMSVTLIDDVTAELLIGKRCSNERAVLSFSSLPWRAVIGQ